MHTIDYTEFFENGLNSFRPVMLPHIWEQLLVTDDWAAEGIRCFGASDGNRAVAALAVMLLQNNETRLLSIYTDPAYRRQGIASALFKAAISAAVQSFEVYDAAADIAPGLFFHTEYALPKDDFAVYESFLRKMGFAEFEEKAPSYYFDVQDKNSIPKTRSLLPSFAGKLLSEEAPGHADRIAEYFDAMGLSISPRYCSFCGPLHSPDYICAAEDAGDGSFSLYSVLLNKEAKRKDCISAAKLLVRTITGDHETCTLVVDGEKNALIEIWDEAAAYNGEKCLHAEAGMYAIPV